MKLRADASPFGRSLVLAALIHGLVLVWVAHRVGTERALLPPAHEVTVLYDAPLERDEPAPSPAAVEASENASAPERVAALSGRAPAPPGQFAAESEGESSLEPATREPSAESTDGARRPRLTLEQLGIQDSKQFWSREPPAPTSRHAQAEKKLRQSLQGGIARQDQQRGLGPEGPVLTRLEAETRGSLVPPNSAALFRVVTDRSGRIVSLVVVDSTTDRRSWEKVAERARLALGKAVLRGKAPNGLSFDIRVVSRVQLPSGADPGLEVSALGVPLKKGDGSRSSKVELLPLDVFETTAPPPSAGDPLNLPDLGTASVGGGQGDLADIGATAQRMVRAFVERVWANDAPADAPAKEPN